MKKFLIFALSLLLAVVGCIPITASAGSAENCIKEILDYNLRKTSSASVQEWIDGYLTENADQGTEWYIIALSNYGNYDFTSYKRELGNYLSENEIGSASSRLKFSIALIATGDRSSPYIADSLENSVGEQGIMSLVFGLHILNNGYTCEKYTLKTLTDELLSLQTADGGWSLTGAIGDVDVTAMTVQALAPQYRTDNSVRKAIDEALAFLSSRQNENATYSSYGVSNPESVSQVIIALSSLGIDARKDERFIKNSNNLFDALELFSLKDGGYCHQEGKETNETATVQVFCAAVAYQKMKKEERQFYIFDKKNTVTTEKRTEEAKEKTTSVSTTEKAEFFEKSSTQDTVKTSLSIQQHELVSSSMQTQTTTKTAEKEEHNKTDNQYKIWVITAIIIVAGCFCAGLTVKKKIKLRGCVMVLVAAACAILFVVFANVKPEQNTDTYAHGKNTTGTVTISIRCDTVKDEKNSKLPENGIILDETEFQIDADDTVYDVLLQACRENDIHFETTGAGETLYVEGICNLYEKDYGDLSGWMYFVNEKSPSVGCGNYKLADKDEIVWCYTCDLGADLSY